MDADGDREVSRFFFIKISTIIIKVTFPWEPSLIRAKNFDLLTHIFFSFFLLLRCPAANTLKVTLSRTNYGTTEPWFFSFFLVKKQKESQLLFSNRPDNKAIAYTRKKIKFGIRFLWAHKFIPKRIFQTRRIHLRGIQLKKMGRGSEFHKYVE